MAMPENVRKHLENPPAGSAVARAIEFGIDLSLTARNMYELTPDQRLDALEKGAAKLTNWRVVGRASDLLLIFELEAMADLRSREAEE
jgi:hypothetical protein